MFWIINSDLFLQKQTLDRLLKKQESKNKNMRVSYSSLQASTLTFVWCSGTSENWRRTSRSCITVVWRDKWKSQIPKSISTGIKYCLGLLYKRAVFDLQFVHNLFWLKLKWNTRSKFFYCIIYRSSKLWWSSRTLTKLKSQSQKRFNEWKYQYLKYKNKNHSGTDT
jgi:hypothetical protein